MGRYEEYQIKIDNEILKPSANGGMMTGTVVVERLGSGSGSVTGQYIMNPASADPTLMIYTSFSRTPGQSGNLSRVMYVDNTISIYWGSGISNVIASGPGCAGFANKTAVISGPTRYYTLIYVADPTKDIKITINQ